MKKLAIALALFALATGAHAASVDVTLPAGQQLTVTADATAAGTISHLADSAGGPSQGYTSISASSSVVLGPYSAPSFWRIDSSSGVLSYAVALPSAGTFDSAAITSLSAASSAFSGSATFSARVINAPQDLTVADSGDGSAAAGELIPVSAVVACTCSDADGCALTFSETGAVAGQNLLIFGAAANACTIADSAGVQETTGTLSLGANDVVSFIYSGSAWIQASAVVNN